MHINTYLAFHSPPSRVPIALAPQQLSPPPPLIPSEPNPSHTGRVNAPHPAQRILGVDSDGLESPPHHHHQLFTDGPEKLYKRLVAMARQQKYASASVYWTGRPM